MKDMNKFKTAVFIGHSDCPLSAEDVIPYIEQEIKNGVDTFLNGGQGAFDRTCAKAVRFVKKDYPEIKSILVIPYYNFKIFDKTLFDEIVMPDTSNSVSYTGYKTAILKRNGYMIDKSSAAICYVNYISGGAYKTFQLAKKKKLSITNIYDEIKKREHERTDLMQSKFVAVTTELITLACLTKGANNTRGIMKIIEEHAAQGLDVSRNEAFTALYRLCEKNYVKYKTIDSENGLHKDVYTLLPEGEEYYKRLLNDYNKHTAFVAQTLDSIGGI